MKKLLYNLALLVAVSLLINSCSDTLVDEELSDDLILKEAKINKTGYIVLLNDVELNEELSKLKGYEKKQQAVKNKSEKILKRAGITDGEIEHVYGSAIRGFSVKIPPGQYKKLSSDASVAYMEKDKVVTLIQPLGRKKPPRGDDTPPPQETPWGIIRVGDPGNGIGKTAWIIDSGIDLDHPDLEVDDTGKNASFLSGKQSTNPDDQHGHGTHVAGTVAAKNNSIGVVGVAAGATVVSVRVLDRRGSGFTSGVIAGVDYVAANASGNDVANMSLGGGISTALDNAVISASSVCPFVLAAGNESDDADNHSPARAHGNKIYTISAMDSNDKFASFSNYGEEVDYCAPGVGVKSCYKGGGYATWNGTSMAAPHVAGILLLGNITTSGWVQNDPDGNADPIAHK